MLSLLLWQSKLIFAVRALAKDVRLAVFEFVLSEHEPIFDFSEKSAKRPVFALSLVDIPREKAKQRPKHEQQLDHGNDKAAHKGIDDHKCERGYKDGMIKCIHSVSAIHKTRDAISEFSHFTPQTINLIQQLYAVIFNRI